MAENKVSWEELYGRWTAAGFDVDACVMFNQIKPGLWKDPAHDARAYGEAFAKFFGPSGDHPWVSSVEIGNEPADYSESAYREILQNMAKGLRAGDPKMQIATCAVMTGKPDQWSKPMSAIAGLEDLYDVINVHSYAFKEKWPTYRRSFPEDPSIRWLKDIQDVIQWRDEHAKGKPVWLTEFGYDSATHPPDSKGEWSKWVGVSDKEQAAYIVRSFLVLSSMHIDRAYLYFFDDKDEAQLHGASGITRNYKPKPSFYAMSHLYKSLGDYHFVRAVVRQDAELYCFEYERSGASSDHVYVAWRPTGDGEVKRIVLPLDLAAGKAFKADQTPLTAGESKKVEWTQAGNGVEIEVGPLPVFIWSK